MKQICIIYAISFLHLVYSSELKHGDEIFIDYSPDPKYYLSGARGSDNEKVIRRNKHENDDEMNNAKDTYKWIIQGDSGQCIKYGHAFMLKNKYGESKGEPYLTGSRGSDNDEVYTKRYEDSIKSTYQWIARSDEPRNGEVDDAENDSNYGDCIYDFTQVYLQNKYKSGRWLTYDSDYYAKTRNLFDYGELSRYKWTLKTQEDQPDKTCHANPTSRGNWETLTYSSGPQTVSYTYGLEDSIANDESFSRTDSWELSVTASVENDFAFGKASLEVSATVGGEMTKSVSQLITKTSSSEESYEYEMQAGQVWQFVYTFTDPCHAEPWHVFANNLVSTSGRFEEPCCLPGYALDPAKQHGPCAVDSPCTCSDDVCGIASPSSVPSSAPSSAPSMSSVPSISPSSVPRATTEVMSEATALRKRGDNRKF